MSGKWAGSEPMRADLLMVVWIVFPVVCVCVLGIWFLPLKSLRGSSGIRLRAWPPSTTVCVCMCVCARSAGERSLCNEGFSITDEILVILMLRKPHLSVQVL